MDINRKKSLGIGVYTRKNILAGKNIRKDQDGDDIFEDYWTDKESTSSSGSEASSAVQRDSNIVQNNEQSNFGVNLSNSFSTTKEIGGTDSLSSSNPIQKNSSSSGSRIQQNLLSTGTRIHKNSLSTGTYIHKNSLSSDVRFNKNGLLLKEVPGAPDILSAKPITSTKRKSHLNVENIVARYDEYDLKILQMIDEFRSDDEAIPDSHCSSKRKSVSSFPKSSYVNDNVQEINELNNEDEVDMENNERITRNKQKITLTSDYPNSGVDLSSDKGGNSEAANVMNKTVNKSVHQNKVSKPSGKLVSKASFRVSPVKNKSVIDRAKNNTSSHPQNKSKPHDKAGTFKMNAQNDSTSETSNIINQTITKSVPKYKVQDLSTKSPKKASLHVTPVKKKSIIDKVNDETSPLPQKKSKSNNQTRGTELIENVPQSSTVESEKNSDKNESLRSTRQNKNAKTVNSPNKSSHTLKQLTDSPKKNKNDCYEFVEDGNLSVTASFGSNSEEDPTSGEESTGSEIIIRRKSYFSPISALNNLSRNFESINNLTKTSPLQKQELKSNCSLTRETRKLNLSPNVSPLKRNRTAEKETGINEITYDVVPEQEKNEVNTRPKRNASQISSGKSFAEKKKSNDQSIRNDIPVSSVTDNIEMNDNIIEINNNKPNEINTRSKRNKDKDVLKPHSLPKDLPLSPRVQKSPSQKNSEFDIRRKSDFSPISALNNLSRNNEVVTNLTKTSTPKNQNLTSYSYLTRGKRKLNLSPTVSPLKRNVNAEKETDINEITYDVIPEQEKNEVNARPKRNASRISASKSFVEKEKYNDQSIRNDIPVSMTDNIEIDHNVIEIYNNEPNEVSTRTKRKKHQTLLAHKINSVVSISHKDAREMVNEMTYDVVPEQEKNEVNARPKRNASRISANKSFVEKKKSSNLSIRNDIPVSMTDNIGVGDNVIEINNNKPNEVSTRTKRKKHQKLSANENNSVVSTSHKDVREMDKLESSMNTTTKKQRKIIPNKDNDVLEPQNLPKDLPPSPRVQKSRSQKKSKNKEKNLMNEITNTNEGFMRKSSRKRFPPLARWRNERIVYRNVGGMLDIVEIDEGTKEDDAALKSVLSRMKRIKQNKIAKPKKAKLVDDKNNKVVSMNVLHPFSSIPWDKPGDADENGKYPFVMKRVLETDRNIFGYIQIEIGEEKAWQYMPHDDLHLTIVRGEAEIGIQKNNCYLVKEKDMFSIPRGNCYTIKNVGKVKTLISYAVGRFRFMENMSQ